MVRFTRDQRQIIILVAAVRIAKEKGVWAVTHGAVAKRCSAPTSKSTVKYHYHTINDLWCGMLEYANDDDLVANARECGWIE